MSMNNFDNVICETIGVVRHTLHNLFKMYVSFSILLCFGKRLHHSICMHCSLIQVDHSHRDSTRSSPKIAHPDGIPDLPKLTELWVETIVVGQNRRQAVVYRQHLRVLSTAQYPYERSSCPRMLLLFGFVERRLLKNYLFSSDTEGDRGSSQGHRAAYDTSPKPEPIISLIWRCPFQGVVAHNRQQRGPQHGAKNDARGNQAEWLTDRASSHPLTLPPRPPVVERYLHA